MSKVDGSETSLLNLILAAKPWTSVAVASTASTSIWVSLHTADPADTGDQSTNEISYTGYLRKVTNRTTVDWNCLSGSASPLAVITFATCTASSTVIARCRNGHLQRHCNAEYCDYDQRYPVANYGICHYRRLRAN